jgi:hypothetical protein
MRYILGVENIFVTTSLSPALPLHSGQHMQRLWWRRHVRRPQGVRPVVHWSESPDDVTMRRNAHSGARHAWSAAFLLLLNSHDCT